MYLLKRPDHAEIEARLWRLYIGAEEKMEDYRNRLRFKVEDARRKEQDLVKWKMHFRIGNINLRMLRIQL